MSINEKSIVGESFEDLSAADMAMLTGRNDDGVAVVRGFRSERVFLGMFCNGRHPTCILWELQVNVALHGSGMDCVKHPTHT